MVTRIVSKAAKQHPRSLLLSSEQVDVVNLELAHIRALAGIATDQADQSNEQIMTALMLLGERVRKIESLMQHAWEQSKQKAAA